MDIKGFIKGDGLDDSLKQKREVFFYVIVGGITTVLAHVSFVFFDVLLKNIDLDISFAGMDAVDWFNKILSWCIAVLFSFFASRYVVFLSRGPIWKELRDFVSSRLATLVLFDLLLWQCVIWIVEFGCGIGRNDVVFSMWSLKITWLYAINILINVLVMIGNYFFSKFVVFRTRKGSAADTGEDSAAEDSTCPVASDAAKE